MVRVYPGGGHPIDDPATGRVNAETYRKFNLDFAAPAEQERLLGPFRHAHSDDPIHQAEIAALIRADMVLVAEDAGQIVGILRGRVERLHSLFVSESHHRRGIGRRLMSRFEQMCFTQGAAKITLAATLYAVPFYANLGYQKSTGVRTMHSFDGAGLPYQPMKKVLKGKTNGQ